MKRLQRELAETSKQLFYDIELEDDNLLQWIVAIHGPDNTPYYGGTFLVKLTFPTDYPLTSPTVRFVTKVFSPNVTLDGNVCLDLLGRGWKISTTPSNIIEGLVNILRYPDVNNALYPEAASLMGRDEERFKSIATEWTLKYAI